MRIVRIVLAALLGAALAGCGGAKSSTKFSGGITVSAQGSWSYSDSGSSVTGNESFSAHCTNDGSGVGEFTASLTVHQVSTDQNGSTTTDASGTTDQPIMAGDDKCIGDDAGAEILLLDFNVTGMSVAAGVTLPIDDAWEKYDYANAGAVDGNSFSNAASGTAAGSVGMFSFHSGDVVGGTPSTVLMPSLLAATIPETVSWSFTAAN